MIHNILYDLNSGSSDVSATKYVRTLKPANWSNNIQEITIDGITEDSIIFAGATPDSIEDYSKCGVICSSQYEDTVVFTCNEVPEGNLKVNIFVVEGGEQGEAEPEPPAPTLFGVYWDGSVNSTMLRTDGAAVFSEPEPAVNNGNGSSPFDNIMPWSGMQRVETTEGGIEVSIPKFWYKWTRDDKTTGDMKLQISNVEREGFFVSPAHADRGDGAGERDVVYIGAYHCASSTYKSTSGVAQQVSMTRATARTNISNLGAKYWQFDYAMLWTIRMLYLVEYADWNSQSKIGYGCSSSGNKANNGQTDSMTYHTGTTASSRTSYGFTRYRYIEGLWDNVLDWCDGIYKSSSGAQVYCIKNPANFSDTTGGTLVGSMATSSNEIKSWTTPSTEGFEYALVPATTVSNSSYNTYICDYCSYSSSNVVFCVGGSYGQSQYYGLFCMYSYSASYSHDYIGARLQRLP